jgi:hypothetical protein
MNYQKIYDTLITKAKNREKIQTEYYENHHIIPRCMNGGEDLANKVELTAREHYIAHGLLVKIHRNSGTIFRSLLYSFRYMSVDSHNGNRRNNRDYAWMRKLYSENHPTQNPETCKKISIGLRKHWSQKIERNRVKRVECVCACGCGKRFIKKINSAQIYAIANHSKWQEKNIEKERIQQSNALKRYIKTLTNEQLKERMKKSFGSSDPIARGKAISLTKKGKSTNQKYIEAERYGKMTEEEFAKHIENRRIFVKNRMIKRRIKYLNGLANCNIG